MWLTDVWKENYNETCGVVGGKNRTGKVIPIPHLLAGSKQEGLNVRTLRNGVNQHISKLPEEWKQKF